MTYRRILPALALLGAWLAAPAPALAAPAPSARAQLTKLVCQRAVDPVERAISVTATMRPVAGTRSLQMRAGLVDRGSSHGSFSPVPIPAGSKLGSWISPTNPSLGGRMGDIWMVRFPVLDLLAPRTYRFVVTFRWLGGGGRVLSALTENSADCYQPELRPDLLVKSLTVSPGTTPGLDDYTAVIVNAGGSSVKDFEVQFANAGEIQTETIKRLRPNESLILRFIGPVCQSASPPALVLDPQSKVDDSNRANNSATASCPPPPPSDPS
jgi:hypothetical protein